MAEENSNVLTSHYDKKKIIQFFVIMVVTAIVWNLPIDTFGIDGLTIVQQRIIAIFVFATLSWLTECIPSWATSLGIITIMCLTVSDNALMPFKGENIGELMDSKHIMASFADPTIMLFLGGFILAAAATKSGLDVLLARNLIRPFGTKSENVLLGFLLITGIFSMFVSNTATAMMLTFLTPVFAALPANGKGRIALTMSIPIAANLGGMGTPIGTPPNMIALKFLNDPAGLNMGIDFGHWMAFMFPLVIILLIISWRILLFFFPFSKKTIELEIKGSVHHGWRMNVVIVTFIITILLWVIPKSVTGIDSYNVAMVPIGVFAVTGVITAKDLQEINWSVIWMVAGGFALGFGMNGSGLADAALESIPFGEWSPIVILLISGLICYILSNFISNTATAALLVPILAVVCTGMGDKLHALGGTSTVLIGIAIAASSAMCLPISTPPNAIAYSTGLVKQNDMLKMGLICGIVSLVLGYSVLYFIGKSGFLL